MSVVPRATYRLQLRPAFDFSAAADVVPYLARLGISHLYLSPVTTARKGSTHGYDVVDYNALNPELGGEAEFDRLSRAARANGLGVIIDFVPNHMAASVENLWWRDVLAKGEGSRYARFFDIDWKRCDGYRHPVVTLPLLDRPLDRTDFDLELDHLVCNGVRLPLADGSAGSVDNVLRQQHYRLIRWQDAPRLINYRRFFDINDLVGIDTDQAFDAMHRLVGRLARDGSIDGIRLDHVDGLRDPAAYCERLRRLLAENGLQDPYIVVEKILGAEEQWPRFPGIQGTTGYETLNAVTRLLVDERGLAALDSLWREIGAAPRMREQAKRQVLQELFPGALDALAGRLPAGDRAELVEYLVRLPVYRTYVTADGASEADRRIVCRSTASPTLRQTLLAPSAFVFRLQQFTGQVMAKSIEDTLFYRDFRLLAFNEVGGEPDAETLSPEEFHARIARRASEQPNGMNATATHDTKRGEDARLRIASLSLMPGEWRTAWGQFPAAPELSPSDRYMICQSLAGGWPLEGGMESFAARMREYAVKAIREGKMNSRWTAPDDSYEKALTGFVDRLLLDAQEADFRRRFGVFAERIALRGAVLSLVQLTLKATLPGVPDFYQGCEGWDLSFVDPDNRRPVDYAARAALLDDAADWAALARNWRDGRIKFALTRALLGLRKAHPTVFASGDYTPVETPDETMLAFARRCGDATILVAVCHAPSIPIEEVAWPDFSGLRGRLPRRVIDGMKPVLDFGALPIAVFAST